MKKDNLIFGILGLSAICIYAVNCTTQPEFSHYDSKSSAATGVIAQARGVQSCAALQTLIAKADDCYGGYGDNGYGGYDYGGYGCDGYDYGGYDYGGYGGDGYGGYDYGGYGCDPYYGGYDSNCDYGGYGYDSADLIGALNAANARLGCGFTIAPAQCY